MLRVILCGIALAVIQQTTGINTVIYYAPTIFQQAGFHSALSSILATAGVGLLNVGMTIVSIPLLDRVGRRHQLLTSLGGMFVSLLALSLGFAIGGVALKWIGVLSLAVYIASCDRAWPGFLATDFRDFSTEHPGPGRQCRHYGQLA